MTFTVIDSPQRSDEWRKARAGRVTGSRVDAISSFLKNGAESAARRDYKMQLVCERLTGQPQDSDYTNRDMERGIELEPLALAAYEVQSGALVSTSGFLQANDCLAGCSLDGHIGNFEGLVEVKAPRPANHLKHIRANGVPAEHRAQLVHALWVTGAAYVDFVSYCPQFPEPLALFVVRLYRAEILPELEKHGADVGAFLDEVAFEESSVRGLAATK